MKFQTRQQAWISGLTENAVKGGVPFKTLPISMPKSDSRSLSFTVFGAKELVSSLQSLAKAGTKLKTFSLVVRTNAEKQLDNQLMMAGVTISSVTPNIETPEAQTITVAFESMSARMGVTLNPGPPVNCPPIQQTGANVGWVIGLSEDKFKQGRSLEAIDFTPPHFNRRLTITLGKPSGELIEISQNPASIQELILILPDRSRQRYVEFKLWDAKVILLDNEQNVAFESDMIECLTGKDD